MKLQKNSLGIEMVSLIQKALGLILSVNNRGTISLKLSKKTIAFIIFLVAVIGVQAQENHLVGYQSLAAENNAKLKALFDQYMAALEKLPQAKALPDPMVMFNLFASPIETRVGAQKAGFTVSQAFPWFGQLRAQEEVAAMKAKALFETFKDEKNKIHYETHAVYNDLYMLEVAMTITQRNIELLNSFKELAQIKVESGTSSQVDVLRVEMEIAQLENQLNYLMDSRKPSEAEFRALLNSEVDIPIVLPSELIGLNITDSKVHLIETMLANNPNVKKLDFEINSLDNEINVAQSLGKPSFNLGVTYTSIAKRDGITIAGNGKDALIFPQIGLRIPLYRKKYNAMVNQKAYMKSASAHDKVHQENVLSTAMEVAWRNYKDAERRIDLNRRLSALARQSLDILVVQYTSAGQGFEEILRMERQVLTFELESERATTDQNTSVAFINYLIGK